MSKSKVKWFYLYRAIDKQGNTLDFYFSKKRNNYSAYQFLKRCLKCYALDKQPKTLNTDVSAQLSSEALLGLIDWEVPRHKISKIILRTAGREHFE